MARSAKKLSVLDVRSKSKPGRYADGDGLYLNVAAGGSKSWMYLWMRGGRRREMGLGAFPTVSLADARARAEECRQFVAKGLDRLVERKRDAAKTFGEAADDFLASMKGGWSNEVHRKQWEMTLGDAYCKALRPRPVSDVDTADVLKVLTPIWQTKAETASRLRGRIERVLDFAEVKGWREGKNPAAWRGHLKNALPARKKLTRGHHAAMPYEDVPDFMVRIGEARAVSARALEFLILTASRTGEVIEARWEEFDLKRGTWTVPAERMKMRRVHRVPLTAPVLAILEALKEGAGEFVFPGQVEGKPLSNMAMKALMKRHKAGHLTPHGFRSAFRDWVGDETAFPRELAEAALAHQVGDETERAYRRSDALEKRRQLMDAWAKFCGGSAKVVPLRAAGHPA